MLNPPRPIRIAFTLAFAISALGGASADVAQEKFYRAYYLERGEGDLEAAGKLYREVSRDDAADRKLVRQARVRLASLREELAVTDFARLMPPDAIAYVELNRPGDQVLKLLDQFGLLAKVEERLAERGDRVAISPAIIKEILGIRGIAVAITDFDPRRGEPSGVAVFHPGDVELFRGLIETALPIGGQVSDPIGGFPTYDIEGKVLVTLTKRLVIVSTERDQIAGVLRRLEGKERASLANNKQLAEVLADRDDSLLFFCINAKPILPLLRDAIAKGGRNNRELAMADAVLDLDSLQALSGRIGVGDDGIFIDIGVRLDEGHHNLAFNLLRTPAIGRDAFKSIPQGVAAFLIAGLNEAPSRFGGGTDEDDGGAGEDGGDTPIVTALDFGRELFANIVSISAFVLPPDGSSGGGRNEIPDAAVVLRVKDPSKSRALWTQMLGLASMATGASSTEGETIKLSGVEVRSYNIEDEVTIFFATVDNDVLISPSRSAVARVIKAKRGGKSILDDPQFAESLGRVGHNSTLAIFAHPARCIEIGKPHMGRGELREIAKFLPLLSDTVVSVVVNHSDRALRVSAMVTGIPDVSDLVNELVREHRPGGRRHVRRVSAQAYVSGETDETIESDDDGSPAAQADSGNADGGSSRLFGGENGSGLESLKAAFDKLALEEGDRDKALKVGKAMLKAAGKNAQALNNFAWVLLTEDQYEDQYTKLALALSERSNEISDYANWYFLDTLALAKFKTGDVREAVKLERKALKACDDDDSRAELEEALKKFEAALGETRDARSDAESAADVEE